MGEQGGRQQILPDVPRARRRAGTGVLLGPGDLLGERGGAVAVPGLRPGEADPAVRSEGAFPGTAALSGVGMRAEPCLGFRTERIVLGTESEVHETLLYEALGGRSNGIGSAPTVPGRNSAIRSGVQAPSAYAARNSLG